jgi:hypothetical protein
MNELVERLTAKVGSDELVAKKTIGIVPDFLRNEGSADHAHDNRGVFNSISDVEASGDGLHRGGRPARLMGCRLSAVVWDPKEIQSRPCELFKVNDDTPGPDRTGGITAVAPGRRRLA